MLAQNLSYTRACELKCSVYTVTLNVRIYINIKYMYTYTTNEREWWFRRHYSRPLFIVYVFIMRVRRGCRRQYVFYPCVGTSQLILLLLRAVRFSPRRHVTRLRVSNNLRVVFVFSTVLHVLVYLPRIRLFSVHG